MFKEDDWLAPFPVRVGSVSPDALVRILGPVPVAAPPPPPSVHNNVQTPRIPVGGILQSAKLIRQPKPVYPELARRVRIQGVVKLHALISKEGTIEELKVVSGHPLLFPSALEAVKQWAYSTDPAQWRARRSGNGHRCELYLESVSAPIVAVSIRECITPTAEA